jgi:alpha-mannosidase
LADTFSLAFVGSTEQYHNVVEAVKQAEDGSGAWIFRVYESMRYRREHNADQLLFGLPVRRAVECNLVEEEEKPLQVRHNALLFSIAPYEIKTFKVWFA